MIRQTSHEVKAGASGEASFSPSHKAEAGGEASSSPSHKAEAGGEASSSRSHKAGASGEASFGPSHKESQVGPPLTLETPVQYLKDVGPKRADFFRRLGIKTLRDLIFHLPRRHEDRRAFGTIAQLEAGKKGTVCGVVTSTSLFRAKTGTLIFQVVVKDASGTLTALWFNQPYMRRWFPLGQGIVLFGLIQQVGRKLQMVVPEFELIPKETTAATPGVIPRSLHMGRVVPIYPATSGLHQRELRTAVARALKALLPTLADPIPPEIRQRHELLDFETAIKRIHFPPTPDAVISAQARFTFEELLCFQLALAIRRRNLETRRGISHEVEGDLVARWKAKLPFTLTPGQEKAVEEISKDLADPTPMHRLLQGEVGSGKTVVAAFAMVVAVQNGFQAAVLAPTEVLARQHALTLSQLFAPVDLTVTLLTSSLDEAGRRQLAQELASGRANVLVGTHAILEPWVKFQHLGLAVIDEQQKFGVDQRNALAAKGEEPDLLILTATPIPRTLALTLYGEMEISTISEKPIGRHPVRTLWMDSTRRSQVYTFVKSELDAGHQAYVVCPRIGKEDDFGFRISDFGFENVNPQSTIHNPKFISATQLFKEYQQIFTGHRVGLLHGRMAPVEQKGIFAAFKAGEIQVLVATQVIEVGVDVPNATAMVIEGADRFGLAQLHQLRGRVGRGKFESTCILMADPNNPLALERLQKVVEMDDAFRIAEEDLRLRGPGELLGKRQAGLPDLKCLEWASQGPWMEITKKEAQEILDRDTGLASPEIQPLKKEMFRRFPEIAGPCA